MTAPDDLIRRGDMLKIVFPDACSETLKGALCLHPSCDAVRFSPTLDALRALPADPVAEAAGKLAEKVVRDGLADFARVAVVCRYDCEHAECLSIRYRAAVAARSAGTVPPAPKPAPACARCGGRGCVPRVYLGTGTVGEDDCPDCGGKP